ncbi:hypothetical protein L9F63_015599, partial [Diploptera punctata]
RSSLNKFVLRFTYTSCERSLNYATKMARMLQSSTYCMDRSNVSRWCTFFQEGRVNL